MSEFEIKTTVPNSIIKGIEEGVYVLDAGGGVLDCSLDTPGKPFAYIREFSKGNSSIHDPIIKQALGKKGSGETTPRTLGKNRREKDADKLVINSDIAIKATEALGLFLTMTSSDSDASYSVDIIGNMLKITTLTYLRGRFNRLDHLVTATVHATGETLEIVQDIQDIQFVGFTKKVSTGLALFHRYEDGAGDELLSRAIAAFEEGLAEISTIFQMMDGGGMLENATRVQHLLKLAALCGAFEIQALNLAKGDLGAQAATLKAHMRFWTHIQNRLDKTPGPSERIPTLAMLKTQRESGLVNTQKRWRSTAQSLIEIMTGELAFIESLKELSPAKLKEIKEFTSADEQAVLCLTKQ